MGSQRPVRGRAGEANERLLFSRLTPISFHLKVVAAELRYPFVEQSDRMESPCITNEACKVAMADMHN